ncbi:hypothetical protein [Massilia sp. YMA4]|uniref:hypothetical protein n=1 Tax=Massilia sp. YMA4 TaxID=1593482 RepID=UPI001581C19D|nr:hypothetical protein [Massilia sp. YMA4]
MQRWPAWGQGRQEYFLIRYCVTGGNPNLTRMLKLQVFRHRRAARNIAAGIGAPGKVAGRLMKQALEAGFF